MEEMDKIDKDSLKIIHRFQRLHEVSFVFKYFSVFKDNNNYHILKIFNFNIAAIEFPNGSFPTRSKSFTK